MNQGRKKGRKIISKASMLYILKRVGAKENSTRKI
jgi:hypothetical protein